MAWPIGVTTILGLTVAANLFMLRIANDDPSFAIEPDYYQRAVRFDSTMAEERRSTVLGWTVAAALAQRADRGAVNLEVVVLDRTAQPVNGATVTVAARFNARANDVRRAMLRETAPGRYAALLDAQRPGQWEIDVTVLRGKDRFVRSVRTELSPAIVSR
jgi:nitrogen fixation protein FixH